MDLKKKYIFKNLISNKCCSFELSIHQRILKKNNQFPQKYEAAQLFLTLLIIRNVSWTASHDHREPVCVSAACRGAAAAAAGFFLTTRDPRAPFPPRPPTLLSQLSTFCFFTPTDDDPCGDQEETSTNINERNRRGVWWTERQQKNTYKLKEQLIFVQSTILVSLYFAAMPGWLSCALSCLIYIVINK